MDNYRGFDGAMQSRRDGIAQQHQRADAGSGGCVGMCMVIAGIVMCFTPFLPIGLIAIVGGAVMAGGTKVSQDGLDNMADAAQDGPDAVNRSFAVGFGMFLLWCLIGFVVLGVLFVALAQNGQIAGVTL